MSSPPPSSPPSEVDRLSIEDAIALRRLLMELSQLIVFRVGQSLPPRGVICAAVAALARVAGGAPPIPDAIEQPGRPPVAPAELAARLDRLTRRLEELERHVVEATEPPEDFDDVLPVVPS